VLLVDGQAGEDYYTGVYQDPDFQKLKAPIVAVIGETDRATDLYQERVGEWLHFAGSVSLATIPAAGHYFNKHQAGELADIITAGDGEPVAAAPPRAGLRTFVLVALGQFISLIGTGLTTFGMGLWVYQHTQSVTLFAAASVAAIVPAVVVVPFAGAIADRWNRRVIMILSDTFAACGSLALAVLLALDRVELWHIYVIVVVGAIANAFQLPAYLAAVTQLVPKRYYGKANGLVQLGQASGTVLGPLLGGALAVAIGLSGILVIDLATFLVAVTITGLVRFPDALFIKREEPFLRELTGGWRYIARRHGLVVAIGLSATLNFLFAMVEVLATPLTLSLGAPTVLGIVLAASGAGLLTGSVLMSVWGGTARRMTGIIASFLLIGISMMVIGLRPDPVFPAIGLFGMGLATGVLNAHWLAIVQAKVGLELQGRVISTTLMLSWLMAPAGFLVAGPLARNVFEPLLASDGPLAGSVGQIIGTGPGRGIALLVILAGIGCALLAAAARAYRPVRALEEHMPDAIPSPVVITDKDLLQAQVDQTLERT
jgi:hypothetical protein